MERVGTAIISSVKMNASPNLIDTSQEVSTASSETEGGVKGLKGATSGSSDDISEIILKCQKICLCRKIQHM